MKHLSLVPFVMRLAALLLATMPLLSHAQIFICKDAAGRTLTADRPIPECATRPMREITTTGVLKQQIAAPLTPEQRRQKELDDQKRKAEEAVLDDKRQSDRILMNRYLTMAELQLARKRALEQWQEKIDISNSTLSIAARQRKETEVEIAATKTKNVPQSLRNKIEQADMTIENETKSLHVNQVGMAEAKARFEEMLNRYKELTAQPVSSSASAASVGGKQH